MTELAGDLLDDERRGVPGSPGRLDVGVLAGVLQRDRPLERELGVRHQLADVSTELDVPRGSAGSATTTDSRGSRRRTRPVFVEQRQASGADARVWVRGYSIAGAPEPAAVECPPLLVRGPSSALGRGVSNLARERTVANADVQNSASRLNRRSSSSSVSDTFSS